MTISILINKPLEYINTILFNALKYFNRSDIHIANRHVDWYDTLNYDNIDTCLIYISKYLTKDDIDFASFNGFNYPHSKPVLTLDSNRHSNNPRMSKVRKYMLGEVRKYIPMPMVYNSSTKYSDSILNLRKIVNRHVYDINSEINVVFVTTDIVINTPNYDVVLYTSSNSSEHHFIQFRYDVYQYKFFTNFLYYNNIQFIDASYKIFYGIVPPYAPAVRRFIETNSPYVKE